MGWGGVGDGNPTRSLASRRTWRPLIVLLRHRRPLRLRRRSRLLDVLALALARDPQRRERNVLPGVLGLHRVALAATACSRQPETGNTKAGRFATTAHTMNGACTDDNHNSNCISEAMTTCRGIHQPMHIKGLHTRIAPKAQRPTGAICTATQSAWAAGGASTRGG